MFCGKFKLTLLGAANVSTNGFTTFERVVRIEDTTGYRQSIDASIDDARGLIDALQSFIDTGCLPN